MIQRDVNYTKVKNGIKLEMTLDPLASRFVIFKKYTAGINDDGLYYNLLEGLPFKLESGNIRQPIDLSTDWNISFDPDWGGPKSLILDKLVSWSDLEDKSASYYSGVGEYTREFSLDETLLTSDIEPSFPLKMYRRWRKFLSTAMIVELYGFHLMQPESPHT
ncbi:hypothetical protein [Algoriphagus boritolerans]|uniref:hypothetical protein n=1 Tax=Algoriphagus boritolerans TaxID=308111 RepID=UPI002FCE5BE7